MNVCLILTKHERLLIYVSQQAEEDEQGRFIEGGNWAFGYEFEFPIAIYSQKEIIVPKIEGVPDQYQFPEKRIEYRKLRETIFSDKKEIDKYGFIYPTKELAIHRAIQSIEFYFEKFLVEAHRLKIYKLLAKWKKGSKSIKVNASQYKLLSWNDPFQKDYTGL